MKFTQLGKSDLSVSRIALGCMSYGVPKRGAHRWSLDEEKSRPFIKQALELGIIFSIPRTFIPTARVRKSLDARCAILRSAMKLFLRQKFSFR